MRAMKHTPLTRQRSEWEQVPSVFGGAEQFRRRVGDGTLVAILAQEPTGWHLSISFRDHKGRLTRYPRWDEIVHARDALTPLDVAFAMILPTADEYVALHDTTFHLHEMAS